jgi:hypothetical protein
MTRVGDRAGWIGGVTVLGVLLGVIAPAWAADPVAVLTEIRPGQGEVRVKRAADAGWVAPQPLLALRPGDQIRVTADGRAVIALTGGGLQTVTAGNSPYTVVSARGDSGSDRVHGLLTGVTQFLLGRAQEPAYQSLSVRGAAEPARIVAPRATKVLAGPVTFEWTGPRAAAYRVRVEGASGLVWEQDGLTRQPVTYPAAAPAIQPGARYTWTLDAPGQATQRAEFETLPTGEAERVRAALADLSPGTLSGYPAGTLVLLRAGFLVQQGLYADARRELVAGIATDPDEASLHQLLADVYARIGLDSLAAEESDEAQYLATRTP